MSPSCLMVDATKVTNNFKIERGDPVKKFNLWQNIVYP